jgi:hypothetical protein
MNKDLHENYLPCPFWVSLLGFSLVFHQYCMYGKILVPTDIQVETRVVWVIANVIEQSQALAPHDNYKLQLYCSLTLVTHY